MLEVVVPMGRIELPTSPLPRECSTTEPHGHLLSCLRTGDEYGTRELNPGKVEVRSTEPLPLFGSPTWARTRDLRINSPALYQLSYRGTKGLTNRGRIVQD